MLLTFMCFDTVTNKAVHYVGQAAIVRDPNTGVRMFATSKHNLTTHKSKVTGNLEICNDPHLCTLGKNGSAAEIIFPNTGLKLNNSSHKVDLRDGYTWSCFDNSLGPVVDRNTGAINHPNRPAKADRLNRLIEQSTPFEVVWDDFLYKKGLKIGVVVYYPGAQEEEKEEDFSEEVGGLSGVVNLLSSKIGGVLFKAVDWLKLKIFHVFRQKADVMIYTGVITRDAKAGEDHVEYNVNTFKGCSGGIVIVMDRKHPDFGKAIAIHAGYSKSLKTNLGFKLAAGTFDRA